LLDRLVYILFFIFVGSGLFLVYQGLQGMGYLKPASIQSLIDQLQGTGQSPAPQAMHRKKPPREASTPSSRPPTEGGASFVSQEVSLADLEAVAFVVRYLEDGDLQAGCQFLIEHMRNYLPSKPPEVKALVRALAPVYERLQSSSAAACLSQVSRLSFPFLAKGSASFWKSEAGSKALLTLLLPMRRTGHFGQITKAYGWVQSFFPLKSPEYKKQGPALEDLFCEAFKKMGQADNCPHLYPVVDSPNLQIYSLAARALYDEEWDRLRLYYSRMDSGKEKGSFQGYEMYLKALYRYFVSKEYESAILHFNRAIESLPVRASLVDFGHYHIGLLRSLIAQERHSEAVEKADLFLKQLDREQPGPSEIGMALMMQKQIALYKKKESFRDSSTLARFEGYKPDDPFGVAYKKAFSALLDNDKKYQPTVDYFDFREVAQVLKQN
jgi:tetratricopeptide (TPR) repeat protein